METTQNNTIKENKTLISNTLNKSGEMIKLYKIEVLKEFDFNRVGEIKNLFENDFKRIEKQYKGFFKLIGESILK